MRTNLISQQNYENEMRQKFQEQMEKELLLQQKKEEATKIRESLEQLNDEKNESQIQKYYEKSNFCIISP